MSLDANAISQADAQPPVPEPGTQPSEPGSAPGLRIQRAFFNQRVSSDTLEWIRQCRQIADWGLPDAPVAVRPPAAKPAPPVPRTLVWDEPETAH